MLARSGSGSRNAGATREITHTPSTVAATRYTGPNRFSRNVSRRPRMRDMRPANANKYVAKAPNRSA
jgi:hypothetical protein